MTTVPSTSTDDGAAGFDWAAVLVDVRHVGEMFADVKDREGFNRAAVYATAREAYESGKFAHVITDDRTRECVEEFIDALAPAA